MSPHFFPMHRSPKKLKTELSEWKCMMIVALHKKQILTYEILPEGQTVDSIAYLNFLERRVLPEVNRKKLGRPIILHDNARPHKHRIIKEFLHEKRWEELEHPVYSPDMSPPDMHGTHLIKVPNKGQESSSRVKMSLYGITKRQFGTLTKITSHWVSQCYLTAGRPSTWQMGNILNNYKM
jgi:hypothetical protein